MKRIENGNVTHLLIEANENKPEIMRFFVDKGPGSWTYYEKLAEKQREIDAAKEQREQDQDRSPERGD